MPPSPREPGGPRPAPGRPPHPSRPPAWAGERPASPARAEADGAGPLVAQAERLVAELTGLVQQLAAHYAPLPASPLSIDVHLDVPLGPAGPAAPGEAPPGARLLATLHERLAALAVAAGGVPPGRVYCFQCARADCGHSAPHDPRHVFFAYTATGKPEWREFTAACLDWGEPRVDALYAAVPEVLAVTRSGSELTRELIAGFGKATPQHRLLGQVAMGYLPLRSSAGDAPERSALTFQIVATRPPRGPWQPELRIVGPARDVGPRPGYPEWWDRHALRGIAGAAREELGILALRGALPTAAPPPVRPPVRSPHGRGRAAGVPGTGPPGRADLDAALERVVAPVLARLKSSLERAFRGQPHRTQHAREHQFERARPVSAAMREAATAPPERLFFEPERDTVIVLGKRNRVHVFSRAGRHVTSLHCRPEAVARHCETGRWQPLDPALAARFRRALHDAAAGGQGANSSSMQGAPPSAKR